MYLNFWQVTVCGQPEAEVAEELEMEHIAKFVASVEEMLLFAWPYHQLQAVASPGLKK